MDPLKNNQSSDFTSVASFDEKDLRLAAEALVDAAIVCQQYRRSPADDYAMEQCGNPVSEETRLDLIDAVYRDPLMTGRLLDLSFWLM